MAVTPTPGSKPDRDRLRAQLMVLGYDGQRLAEAMAADLTTRCGKRPREAWRLAAGLSLDAAAARYNAITDNPNAPMRKNRIWDFEQWPTTGIRPVISTLKVLAQIYGTSWDHLVDLADLKAMPPEDRDAFHALQTTRLRHQSTAHLAERSALPAPPVVAPTPLATTSSTPETVIAQAAEESVEFATWCATSNVDSPSIEALDRSLRAIAHAYLYGQPYPLLVRARQLHRRITRLLHGHQPLPRTRDLYLLGARACTLLAWISADLGHYGAADDHALAGWLCAENADHNGARTWVRATQAKVAYWAGDYVQSAQLAEHGLAYSPTDSAAVMLALLQARAQARLGRVDAAQHSLDRWRTEREHVPGPDQVGGVLGTSIAQQHYLAGSTHLYLRQPAQALSEAHQAVACFEATAEEARFYGPEMLTRTDAAHAYLQQGELHGALTAIAPVLAVEPEQRLRTMVQAVAQIQTALAGPTFRGSADAQNLQDQIAEYRMSAIGSPRERAQ